MSYAGELPRIVNRLKPAVIDLSDEIYQGGSNSSLRSPSGGPCGSGRRSLSVLLLPASLKSKRHCSAVGVSPVWRARSVSIKLSSGRQPGTHAELERAYRYISLRVCR